MADLRLPLVGETIAGKYELVESIGQGGMAVVFRAFHRRLGQNVAVKVLSPAIAANDELRRRFEQEARVLARIRAPHVVTVHDVDQLPNGLPYMVLEYLVGQDLEAWLADGNGAPIPVDEVVDFIHQAALGMRDAHRAGVIHRDLKPSNLFLCSARPLTRRWRVKVVDFGISKIIGGGDKLTVAQSTFGTPLYMSPEQIRSAAHVDERSDVWSLGAILFECLAGTPAFLRDSPTAIFAAIIADPLPDITRLRPDLPPALAECIRRALVKDPAARIGTMGELADRLSPFVPAERIALLSASPPPLRSARVAAVSDPSTDPSETAVTLARTGAAGFGASRRRLIIAGSLATTLAVGLVSFVHVSGEDPTPAPRPTTTSAPAAAAPAAAPTASAAAPAAPSSTGSIIDRPSTATDAGAASSAPSASGLRRAPMPSTVASPRPSPTGVASPAIASSAKPATAMPAHDPIAP